MPSSTLLVLILLFISLSLGNVEKTIFLGPELSGMPNDSSLDKLYLVSLSPQHSTVRTHLNATFPAGKTPRGSETWMLLEGLTPGTRYEVRICWLATQPTAFSLHTHAITNTFETPDLISSLTSFAYARRASLTDLDLKSLSARRIRPTSSATQIQSSLLFLQIFAAADYFSLDESLMETVPPVLVDVILDPFLLNVFPQSLLPTAGYILVLAIVAWLVSGYMWKNISGLAKFGDVENDKKTI